MSKRFYREVTVTRLDDGGFGVALDGRPVRTPARAPFTLPTAALAQAIADEWAAQEGEVRPRAMPMMRLAATAIDRVGGAREELVGRIAAYAGFDLLCYRASTPQELVRQQAATWQPLLDWAQETFGAHLAVTEGVTPVAQPPEALAALRRAVEAHEDFPLAALSQLTAACGSLVLALAAAHGHVGPERAVAASQLDEAWQAAQWGHDSEAAGRRVALAEEIAAAIRFLELLRG